MRRAGRRLVRTAQPSKTGDAIIPSLFPGGRGMADRQTTQLRTKMLGAVLRQARTAAGRALKETAALIRVSGAVPAAQEAFEAFLKMPADLRDFVGSSDNEPYLRMAQRLSDIPVEKVRSLGEGFLEITLCWRFASRRGPRGRHPCLV